MLTIKVHISDFFNEETDKFVTEAFVLDLEHSLVSLSKWESEFEKPFLDEGTKTSEETLAYIRCMILTPEYPSDLIDKLTQANIDQIQRYIAAKKSATWFNEPKFAKKSSEKITSELIYYWMFSSQIPIEVETWHLNRLFTLIKVFNAKNSTEKKMSRQEAAAQQRMLNEQRRAQYNTKG